MRQKDIEVGKLYTNGKTIRGVVRIYQCEIRETFVVEYTSSVDNFCGFRLTEQPLKNFAKWAKMNVELELRIEEE